MIKDLRDLRSLLTLCRSKGITEFKMNGIEIKFGELPLNRDGSQSLPEDEVELNPYDGFPQDIMSPAQLQHYATGGTVNDDPFLKRAT